MEYNVGEVDRWVRIGAGIVLAALGLTVFGIGTIPGVVATVVGVVLVATGAVRTCLLYRLFGVNTADS